MRKLARSRKAAPGTPRMWLPLAPGENCRRRRSRAFRGISAWLGLEGRFRVEFQIAFSDLGTAVAKRDTRERDIVAEFGENAPRECPPQTVGPEAAVGFNSRKANGCFDNFAGGAARDRPSGTTVAASLLTGNKQRQFGRD